MQLMDKCHGAVMLYNSNNPVYQEAAQRLNDAVGELWSDMDELLLRVREKGFTWHGHAVLEEKDKGDSMAWVLFKDGVMSVRITPGAENGELIEFLDLLHTARTLPEDAEDDFRTLLWAADFETVKCDLAILGYEGGRSMEETHQFEAGSPPAPSIRETLDRDLDAPEGIVDLDEFDSAIYYLDDDEVAHLEEEIEREYSKNLRQNVLAMLFDVLELEDDPPVADEVVDILDEFLPYLLGVGDVGSVAYIVREARTVSERAGHLPDGLRERLTGFAVRLSEPEALDRLLETLDESETLPSDDDLERLFEQLQPHAMETVLGWLPRLESRRAREKLAHATDRLASDHPQAVAEALDSDEDPVVLEALKIVRRLGLKLRGPELGELVSHEGVEVRRALADALGAVKTSEAVGLLEELLADPDRDVRIRAVRRLQNHQGALPRIESAVFGSELRSADLTEKRAFFEAYGRLAGNAGVAPLRSLLVRGFFARLFGRSVDAEVRACAAMALGEIGSSDALEVLAEARQDRDALVRTAVGEALKELQKSA